MLSMRYFNRESREFKDLEINEDKVTSFGIFHIKLYNKNNTFKKFDKKAFVDIDGDRIISHDIDIIKQLRQDLKGKYETSKNNDYEYKNYKEVKCTNWNHIISPSKTV